MSQLRRAPRRRSSSSPERGGGPPLPDIRDDHTFRQVVRKLSIFFKQAIEVPSTFEQLRTTASGNCLRILVDHLAKTCEGQQSTVSALLVLKWYYALHNDRQSLGPTRSHACEIVAWRFLSRFPERVSLDLCLYEIPEVRDVSLATTPAMPPDGLEDGELSPLLQRTSNTRWQGGSIRSTGGRSAQKTAIINSLSRLAEGNEDSPGVEPDDPSAAFVGLNALEIATIAEAKRFLSQPVVQEILTGIWNGTIIYWDALSVYATKQPRFYRPDRADPYSRLRVPKYMKCWEVVFFGVFLCLFYAVLITAQKDYLTGTEGALWFWFAAFLYDELSEWGDVGSVIYTADVWNFFDIFVILIGVVFIIMRIIGISTHNHGLNAWAFDILSLEGLFLIPRIFSILSLSPYWGTLIPCLKEMGKDFAKFMVLLGVFFLGFLTTFSLIGRDSFTLSSMSIILTRIFFGSSYIGFNVMEDIDPVFGPPLMIILVIFSNILLLSSLTGILSNSFSRVINDARAEYLYVYAVYVLEASASNRLIHFYAPFNFIAWIAFQPWAYLFPNSPTIRKVSIATLKITHLPIVAAIKAYELFRRNRFEDEFPGLDGPDVAKQQNSRPTMPQVRPSSAHGRPTMPLHHQGKTLTRSLGSTGGDSEHDESLAAQIAELNAKIDNITTALLSMQENQSASRTAATNEAAASYSES